MKTRRRGYLRRKKTKKNEMRHIVMILLVIAIAVGTIIFTTGKKNTKKDAPSENEKVEKEVETTETETPEEKPEETPPESSETEETAVRTTTDVNLREKADGNSTIIVLLPRGTVLKKIGEENGWAHVEVNGKVGYVSAQYIVDADAAVEEPEQTTSKVEAIPGQYRDANNVVICIDPGHQRKGESTKEPNGPGATTMKARVTGGTTGVATGIAEYIMNLEVSLKLRDELVNRGYTVYMTRTTHDVSISNKERAEYANSLNADITVRIHGNGSENRSVNGAEAYAPSANNPYVSHLSKASISLSQCIIDEYCKATGFKNRGVFGSDTMTGINWCEMPVTIIELGFMSNADDDVKLNDATMQNNMVQGIANGIDKYFGF